MSAQTEAARFAPGSTVRWKAIEVAAFDGHREVLQHLDPAGTFNGGRRRSGPGGLKVIALLPFILIMFAVLGAPIWGFVALFGDRFGRSDPDPASAIPVAGVVFAIGLPFLIISLVLWLRAGSAKDASRETQAVMAMALGTVSAVIVATRGSASDVPGWPGWLIPVAATGLIGGAFTVLLLRARRSGRVVTRTRSEPADGTAVEPLKRVRLAVEKLPPEQLTAIRHDIDAAITDLAARGVVGARDAAWARGAELGKLALRMSQGRGPVATNPRGA